MNEFLSQSAGPTPAPIPSPDDRRVLPSNAAPSTFAAAFGRFLLFGFYGQIAYTVIELGIAANTHGQAEAHASVNKQLLLLVIPLLCSIWGAFSGVKNPSATARYPLAIASLFGAIGVLGVFNLLVLAATAMTGYC